jgi:hypothetical protein
MALTKALVSKFRHILEKLLKERLLKAMLVRTFSQHYGHATKIVIADWICWEVNGLLRRHFFCFYFNCCPDLISSHTINNLSKKFKAQRDLQHLQPNTSFHEDVNQAISLLQQNQWLYEEFTVPDAKGEMRWGLVFAEPNRLNCLYRRGYLTQFDATHKLNKWGYNMFSYLVRNEHNVWIPTAHCVVDRKNSEILAKSLEYLKSWCGGRWQPRYILTEDNEIEQLAIKKCFRDLRQGSKKYHTYYARRTPRKR